ncbi:MAG: hypothetical protein NC078_02100 [Ruminococcus sp.]|nr:hypothetical protein [Ruminococcus sp.]
MTIEEALKQWKISKKTLLQLLSDGKISGLRTENNIIILPDLPKVFQIPSNAKRTAENIYKYILSAVSQGCYLDAKLFGDNFNLSDNDFREYINELERCKLIRRKKGCNDSFSTVGFIISPNKLKDVDKIIHKNGTDLFSNLKKTNLEFNLIKI